MHSLDELMAALRDAEDSEQVACSRFLCEEILKQSPDHGPTLVRYGCTLTTVALYDEAEAVLERAEATVPPHRLQLVYAQQGHRLAALGDYWGAEERYWKAHEHDPGDASYLIYAGSAAFRQGHILRAEELARQATTCTDGCVEEAWFNLGGYLLVQKRYDEASACYLKALAIDPDYLAPKQRLEDVQRVLDLMDSGK
jgi:tetratricopeptide (TPR) repeat protein